MEKFKQKVASTSSKVIESLQQAASGRANQQQTDGAGFQPPPSSGPELLFKTRDDSRANFVTPTASLPGPASIEAQLPAASNLISADATAHLTDAEREILLQVFKKEEQFQLDTRKQLTALKARQSSVERRELAPANKGAQTRELGNNRPQSVNSKFKHQAGASNYMQPQQGDSSEQRNNSQMSIQQQQSVSSVNSASNSSCSYSAHSIISNSQSTSNNGFTPTPSGAAPTSANRSATPQSRPNSTTTTLSMGQNFNSNSLSQSHSNQIGCGTRTGSACSSITSGSNKAPAETINQPVGNCRICRKLITFNEHYHLCSNCKQFICDDCASYSSTDQQWTCSSCRRRATKSAIPADTLRELGLNNQNLPAVRRMTLRQNELKLVANKESSDSTISSNSSSGCSSMSQHQQQSQATNLQFMKGARNSIQVNQSSEQVKQQMFTKQANKVKSDSAPVDEQERRRSLTGKPGDEATAAKQEVRMETRNSLRSPKSGGQISRKLSSNDVAQFYSSSAGSSQQQAARAGQGPGSRSSPQRRTSMAATSMSSNVKFQASDQALTRKQSTAFFTQTNKPISSRPNPAINPFDYGNPRGATTYSNRPQTLITACSNASITADGQQQIQGQSRRDSIMGHQQYQQQLQTLIPIPPDQIHLRRLSDQSNLVRRSSIISETLQGQDGFLIARNRSHSNIDSVSYSNYFYQSPLVQRLQQQQQAVYGYSDDQLNLHNSTNKLEVAGQMQQRRPSDQWVEHQHVAAQQQQQMQQNCASGELTSIVTSYVQKRQNSADELMQQQQQQQPQNNSNSSSDIDDVDPMLLGHYDGTVLDGEPFGQANKYFGPPKGPYDQMMAAAGGGIPIPSVSVSEFNTIHGRHQAIIEQRQQQRAYQFDQVTPMQINTAIEQVIQKQQQSRRNSSQNQDQLLAIGGVLRRGSSGRVLPKIPCEQSRSLLDLPLHQQHSSSSTTELNTYTDQQYSMLDLPAISPTIRRASAPEGQNIKIVVDDIDNSLANRFLIGQSSNDTSCNGGGIGGNGNFGKDLTNGLVSMINSSSTANSRTNQNHQAAYMNSNQMRTNRMYSIGMKNINLYGKQGEFYERLVLYRDDSLDPNTNMARGFGLQVLGGKIDTSNDRNSNNNHSATLNHSLKAVINYILPGGPANKVGIKVGDEIIEWDGKCLVNMTYEQVAEVIESSANIAEVVIKPVEKLNSIEPGKGVNYVRSLRRMSQQTELDLKNVSKLLNNNRTVMNVNEQHTFKDRTSTLNQLNQPIQSARSAGNLPQMNGIKTTISRSGTGRKLPQIPVGLNNDQISQTDELHGYHSKMLDLTQLTESARKNSNSTSMLESQRHQNSLLYSDNQSLSASGFDEKQSRSISELYTSSTNFRAQQFGNNCQNGPNDRFNLDKNYNNYNELDRSTNHQQIQVNDNLHENNYGNQTVDYGSIGLQVNVDERMCQLEICVLSAVNMFDVLKNYSPNTKYYVKVKILPDSNRFRPCSTLPSSNLNWNETLLFQNFPINQIQRMALDIGIWVYDEAPRLSTVIAQPVCETMISIQSARERNTDFWPMRRPPSSPQTRRKSLNDLIDSAIQKEKTDRMYGITQNDPELKNHRYRQLAQKSHNLVNDLNDKQELDNQQLYIYQKLKAPDSINVDQFTRERSASNRNLPNESLLRSRAKPRRASDEVAVGTSHRLEARVSPFPSRRSISVLNVGGDRSRPNSRRGSQINMFKNQLNQRDSNPMINKTSLSAVASNKYPTNQTTNSNCAEQLTQSSNDSPRASASVRKSSLVGNKYRDGYRSQKNSQSDAANISDQESPSKTTASHQRNKNSINQSNIQLTSGGSSSNPVGAARSQHKGSMIADRIPMSPSKQVLQTSSYPDPQNAEPASGTNSRRGSSSIQGTSGGNGSVSLQRKGSFAMITLRKLKRTLSFNKANEPTTQSGIESRKSSGSSIQSADRSIGEDEGVTRRVLAHRDLVGKLKLSFIMTKGQLEIDVISARELQYDKNSALGIYVKMYLKGKSRSNKRKTRLVQPWDSPIFKQLIKYDGSLIDNKSLEISIWQKQSGLKGKIPIGFTEVRLTDLDLSQLQISWYNLRSMDVNCGSSVEMD